jgi:hypothetical protein
MPTITKLGDLWTDTVPVLANNHLPQAVFDKFQLEIYRGERAGAAYREGMWVFMGSGDEENGIPQEMRAVFDWCRKHGFSEYVRFDIDGDVIEGLPRSEW